MYNKGEYIILKSGGIYRIADSNATEYSLVDCENNTIKSINSNSDDIVRTIITKDEMEEVIERIGFIPTIKAPNDKTRIELMEDAMNHFDEILWIKVIKTLYWRQKDKGLTPSEAKIFTRAKNYLHNEISILMEIPMDQVENYISTSLSNDTW